MKGLYDLINEYNIEIDLEKLIHVTDMMKPRYFTIASSSKKNPNTISICASLLEIKANNKWRAGLVSGHLRRALE